ncbi:hypothetical protein [Rhabdaerophilum sp. SD176]|uniref:hypothetical protein n=1 Tax=Rhabdaerophilum sp. SD176 TaxID=2983548 RepID=UPI0024E02783|nr:hypothetical protein [Rhabdaerophilum sp. SD176]
MIEAMSQSLTQSQATSAFPAQGSEVKLAGQVDKSSQAAEGFREALARAHEEITTKGTANDTPASMKGDPVAREMAQILPSPWKSASGAGDASPKGNPQTTGATPPANPASAANDVLRQSFDHAIAVTLISQVVGGVSQTTSTLIRQQ